MGCLISFNGRVLEDYLDASAIQHMMWMMMRLYTEVSD